jgi:hypothetical protein
VSAFTGFAYVFVNDQISSWTRQCKLIQPNGQYLDSFGTDVSIYGDIIAVGVYGDDSPLSNAGN